jgi:sugar phosphate isomerase/epimerase
MFTEVPFLDRFAAAAEAGFTAVEFLFPYDHPPEVVVPPAGGPAPGRVAAMMDRPRRQGQKLPSPLCGGAMPRFAANLTLMFTEVPFLDRFAAAAEAGFTAVEPAGGPAPGRVAAMMDRPRRQGQKLPSPLCGGGCPA